MLPAVRLRLVETLRRGGATLAAVAAAGVLLAGVAGDDPPGARYALATDLAAALAYLFAVFLGAFPLAADRERRRSLLAASSPTSPWAWAAGNAAGAAVAVALIATALFAAAALGPALRGGVETRMAGGLEGSGVVWLRRGEPRSIRLLPGVERMRIRFHVAYPGELRGTADAFRVAADGVPTTTIVGRTTELSASGERLRVENLEESMILGIDLGEARWLGERRSFLANALLAGAGPALGAAALAAFATACSAALTGPVAALLATLVLLLGGLKGFLETTIEEGARRPAVHAHDEAGDRAHGAPGPRASRGSAAARRGMKLLLRAVPDFAAIDPTARASTGEWIGGRGAGTGALLLGASLLLAAALGGVGLRTRRSA